MNIYPLQIGNAIVKPSFYAGSIGHGGMLPTLLRASREQAAVSLPIFAWVIDHPEGIFVVDTGDVARADMIATMQVAPEEQIDAQLAHLGIKEADIKQVILTHLHGDHVGGVQFFPNTPTVVSAEEHAYLHSFVGGRLVRASLPTPASFEPQPIAFTGEGRGSFERSYAFTRSGDLYAVPTPGHTIGHMSIVAVQDGVHYFIAGDVTYTEGELREHKMRGISFAPQYHLPTLAKVEQYAARFPTVYLPSHDPLTPQRFEAKQVYAA